MIIKLWKMILQKMEANYIEIETPQKDKEKADRKKTMRKRNMGLFNK